MSVCCLTGLSNGRLKNNVLPFCGNILLESFWDKFCWQVFGIRLVLLNMLVFFLRFFTQIKKGEIIYAHLYNLIARLVYSRRVSLTALFTIFSLYCFDNTHVHVF